MLSNRNPEWAQCRQVARTTGTWLLEGSPLMKPAHWQEPSLSGGHPCARGASPGREGGKGGHWWAQPQSVVSRRSSNLATTLQETRPTAPKLRRRHGPRDLLQTHIPGPQTSGDLGWGPLGRQHRENLGSGPGVRLLWCGCGQPHGPDDGKGLTGTALGSSLLPAGTNRGRGRRYCSPGHSCHLVTALDSVPGPVPGPSLCHDPVR